MEIYNDPLREHEAGDKSMTFNNNYFKKVYADTVAIYNFNANHFNELQLRMTGNFYIQNIGS